MKHAIEQGKIDELIATIQKTPQVVHENITFGSGHEHQVHPINFICDCVFENKISESTGLEMVTYTDPPRQQQDEFGCSPLLWVVHGLLNGKGRNIRNQQEVIIRLLTSEADPNSKDNNGNTPAKVL